MERVLWADSTLSTSQQRAKTANDLLGCVGQSMASGSVGVSMLETEEIDVQIPGDVQDSSRAPGQIALAALALGSRAELDHLQRMIQPSPCWDSF